MNFNTKCTKCGTTLRRQILFAMMIDAGAKTLDPCVCPEGGDHDFADEDEFPKASIQNISNTEQER